MYFKNHTDDTEYIYWTGQPINNIKHPLKIKELWSEQELNSIGLFNPNTGEDVPEGKRIKSTKVIDVENYPTFVYEFEDIPTVIPQSVSMRAARLTLVNFGLYENVETVLNSLEEPDKTTAKIEWEYATEINRNHNLISILGEQLNLSETQIDDLFLAASQIE